MATINIDLDDIDLDDLLDESFNRIKNCANSNYPSKWETGQIKEFFQNIKKDKKVNEFVGNLLNGLGSATSLYEQQKIDLIQKILEKYNLEELEKMAEK